MEVKRVKKITIIALILAIVLNFTSICLATNNTTGVTNDITVNDNTRTSSITDDTTVKETVVNDTEDMIDTSVEMTNDTVYSVDNNRTLTIIIAVIAILVIIVVSIYYITIPKSNS